MKSWALSPTSRALSTTFSANMIASPPRVAACRTSSAVIDPDDNIAAPTEEVPIPGAKAAAAKEESDDDEEESESGDDEEEPETARTR